jgi:hypothetical protein
MKTVRNLHVLIKFPSPGSMLLIGLLYPSLRAVGKIKGWAHRRLFAASLSKGTFRILRPDYQNSYEKIIPCLLDALSGAHANLLHGGISEEITAHPLLAIIDDDVAEMIGRFIEGVTVNDERYIMRAADRISYDEWTKLGKKSFMDYAKEILEEISSKHKPVPLSPSQDEDVKKYLGMRDSSIKKGSDLNLPIFCINRVVVPTGRWTSCSSRRRAVWRG